MTSFGGGTYKSSSKDGCGDDWAKVHYRKVFARRKTRYLAS